MKFINATLFAIVLVTALMGNRASAGALYRCPDGTLVISSNDCVGHASNVGGRDLPNIRLSCQNGISARFYDFPVVGAPVDYVLYMTEGQKPEGQVLSKIGGARGARQIVLQERHWCTRGFQEKGLGAWVSFARCEGKYLEAPCLFQFR